MNSHHAQQKSNLFFAGIGLLLCLYLIWPAFNAVHLEGFTAQTESIAILKSHFPGIEHDPYLPIVSQFIYQTRSAVVDMLTAIYGVNPSAGDSAFHGLVLASLFLLLASSMVFARRWGDAPPLYALFALVLTQGIPETAFFFNDNIISAAFAVTALALISKKPSIARWLAAGFFIGIAILSRVDAVFMGPMILGVIFYSYKSNRDRVYACTSIGLVALAILIASAVYHGFSLIDAFVTAQKFVLNIESRSRWLFIRVLFFGLITIPLLVIGGWINFRKLKSQHSYIGILTFIVYPALLAIVAPKATEVRYIFPLLAPIIALHAGRGLRWTYEQCLTGIGKKRVVACSMAIYTALVLLAPVTLVQMFDGPRAMLGRLWSPSLWAHWQGSVETSATHAKQLAALLDDKQLNILITTHHNDEFYLRLRLIEAGFVPLPAANEFPGCNGFSVFKKGASTVAHIRTNPQYKIAPVSPTYNAALQISAAFACQPIQAFVKVYVSTFGDNDYGIQPAIYSFSRKSFSEPLNVEFGDSLAQRLPKIRRSYGILNYRALTPAEIQSTRSNADNYLAANPERDPLTGKVVTIEEYNRYYQPLAGPSFEVLTKIKGLLTGGSPAPLSPPISYFPNDLTTKISSR